MKLRIPENLTRLAYRAIAQADTNTRLRRILGNVQGQMLVLSHRTCDLSSGQSMNEHRGISC